MIGRVAAAEVRFDRRRELEPELVRARLGSTQELAAARLDEGRRREPLVGTRVWALLWQHWENDERDERTLRRRRCPECLTHVAVLSAPLTPDLRSWEDGF